MLLIHATQLNNIKQSYYVKRPFITYCYSILVTSIFPFKKSTLLKYRYTTYSYFLVGAHEYCNEQIDDKNGEDGHVETNVDSREPKYYTATAFLCL